MYVYMYTNSKNILYKKVGDIQDVKAIGGIKSKAITSFTKGKCNSPIFSTQTTHKNVLPEEQPYWGDSQMETFCSLQMEKIRKIHCTFIIRVTVS